MNAELALDLNGPDASKPGEIVLSASQQNTVNGEEYPSSTPMRVHFFISGSLGATLDRCTTQDDLTRNHTVKLSRVGTDELPEYARDAFAKAISDPPLTLVPVDVHGTAPLEAQYFEAAASTAQSTAGDWRLSLRCELAKPDALWSNRDAGAVLNTPEVEAASYHPDLSNGFAPVRLSRLVRVSTSDAFYYERGHDQVQLASGTTTWTDSDGGHFVSKAYEGDIVWPSLDVFGSYARSFWRELVLILLGAAAAAFVQVSALLVMKLVGVRRSSRELP